MSTVITVEKLGKKYLLSHQVQRQPYVALRDVIAENCMSWGRRIVSPFLGRYQSQLPDPQSLTREDFWALKDVSFEIKQGDRVGIIGRNGAGKSTLLKILSRIVEPTTGRARIKGRVASLLEVGTGFHPELTGRENIFLNGAILGMTRVEIKKKFDEIVDFAEIEKFLDTPVKRYSSGMYVRLAFAVAAHLEPEILLVDEVLAVGDAQFQKKCLGKMQEVGRQGRTVLFVSHQLDMVRALCSRCILIRSGCIHADETPETVLADYAEEHDSAVLPSFVVEEDDNMPIQIIRGVLRNTEGLVKGEFDLFEQIILSMEYVVHKQINGAIVNFQMKKNDSTVFFSFDTDMCPDLLLSRSVGRYRCHIEIPCPLLKPGTYMITPGTGVANSNKIQHLEDALIFEVKLHSKPSAFMSYSEKRPGALAAVLDWHTERNS